MGIKTTNAEGYQSKVGIALNRHEITPIRTTQNLQISQDNTNIELLFSDVIPNAELYNQLIQTHQLMGLAPKEGNMWVDMPISSNPVIYIAANSTAVSASKKQNDQNPVHKVGICESLVNNGRTVKDISPTTHIGMFYSRYMGHPIDVDVKKAKVVIASQPKHGIVEKTKWGSYTYSVNEEFAGVDTFTMEVTTDNEKFILVYSVHVVADDSTVAPNQLTYDLCKPYIKKISDSSSSSNGQTTVLFGGLLENLDDLFAGFTNLPGTSLGQTTGTGPNAIITLDTDAAGYGWFIDSTPLSNDEFLPTADANIWKAKAGSAAEGKMDMLSVLLHEYGHTLAWSTAPPPAMPWPLP
ncbi:MAG: Ig-like domain-containing protein [Marinagarivorans sp.]